MVVDSHDSEPLSTNDGDAGQQWRLIFEAIGHPTLILRPDHTVVAANRAAERVLGASRGELRGAKCHELFHRAQGSPAGCPLRRMLESGRVETVDMELEALGGTYLVSCTPIVGPTGDVERIIHIATDITARKQVEVERVRLEAQLRHSQKLEAMGRLAGGVAHDFNNLLTVILSSAGFLKQDVGPGSELRADVDEILAAANRAADLTRQLLAFSRKQLVSPQVLCLNEVMESTERMLRRIVGEDVRLDTVLDPKLGPIRADRGSLEQVLVNLAVNARDAMPGGGHLVLRSANVVVDGTRAHELPEVEPGDYVMLSVADDGAGMSPEVRDRIFEPFFTTKQDGRGTGLGLSTVYGIVRQSGGHIVVDSELGAGTTFRVYLPRLGPEATPSAMPPAPTSLPPRRRVILLVEDERPLRRLIRRILESQGHRVLEAGSAPAALERLEGHDGPVHLLLTDLVLPGTSGRALAEQLAEQLPDLRVLYMSGYSDEIVERHGVLDEGVVFLPKPFGAQQLTDKLNEALAAPPATIRSPEPEQG